MLKGKTVLLGVTGSIAAYKTAGLASMLVKKGVKVHVLMTENATHFINPITFESLTATNVWWIHLTGILNSAWSMWPWQSRRMW